jgi:hypothetical protein
MATHLAPHHRPDLRHSVMLRRALLACGVGYGLAYVVANDVIAAGVYDGYSRVDQAISELSATGAPSRAFLSAMLPLFMLLTIAFGVGVWQAAGRSRALRVTGAVLVAQGLTSPLWLLFPMTSREEMVAGATAANDIGHLVLTVLAILFIIAEMGFSAAALGRRFRLFAATVAASALGFGALTGILSADIAAGDPTHWMGVVERISYGSWLLWMAALAIVLLRARGDAPGRPL